MEPATRQIADDVAIRNTIARIAHLADHGGDLDDYLAYFTDDAVWNFPGGARSGQADILAGAIERRANGSAGPGSNSRHLVSTIDIQVEVDTATSNAYFMYIAETDVAPQIGSIGHYRDTWARTVTGWRIKERVVVMG
jgi:3-phenylpropionate/cinnamic acid dioxygenase small subunit